MWTKIIWIEHIKLHTNGIFPEDWPEEGPQWVWTIHAHDIHHYNFNAKLWSLNCFYCKLVLITKLLNFVIPMQNFDLWLWAVFIVTIFPNPNFWPQGAVGQVTVPHKLHIWQLQQSQWKKNVLFAWLGLNFKLKTSWVALYSIFCLSVVDA